MKAQNGSFKTTVEKPVSLNYLLYLPQSYAQEADKEWPFILFLHGMGERGNDLELVKNNGIPKTIEEKEDFPFVVVAPQCPLDSLWVLELDSLYALVQEILHSYSVDRSRVYLTGLSMGGFGAWHLAEAHPELFAAVVPICGGANPDIGFPERIKILKDTPIWAFHGAKDDVVPLEESQKLVEVLKAHNGKIRFTVYPDLEHDSWTRTYDNPKLYEWMLEQRNDRFT